MRGQDLNLHTPMNGYLDMLGYRRADWGGWIRTNVSSSDLCLTAWLHPNKQKMGFEPMNSAEYGFAVRSVKPLRYFCDKQWTIRESNP